MRKIFSVALATWCVASYAQAQTTLGCTTGGGSGVIPTAGTGGGGTFPGTFPPNHATATINVVSTPAGATCVTGVVIRSLTHTYTGDVQFILETPSGSKINLVSQPGGGCDYSGDYTITGLSTTPFPGCAVNPIPSGSFQQYFGNWPDGTQGVFNTDLSNVAPATGTWTLYAYDWIGGDIGGFTSFEVCFGTPPPPPPPPPTTNCQTPIGGSGGIPTSGTGGGGVWPTTLPPFEYSNTITLTNPGGAIGRVKLNGLTHTWVGDLQITLTDPAGVEHNLIHRPLSTAGSVGFNCDVNGDYSIYELFGADIAGACGPDNYKQHFGSWPTGTLNIFNTPLSSILSASGNYTLKIYDWAGADTGSITSWEVCTVGVAPPASYCTSGTSTNGCNPTISATAQPSATLANACQLNVAGVEGQKSGLTFYGINNTGFTPIPWASGSNSFLCVKAPTQRMVTQNSGGTVGQCDGSLTQNWNAFQTANPAALGNPFSSGNKVFAQAWYRDPSAVKTTNLSDAVEMTMQP